MSEAGQIFALLRSWSAAELAKRFASGDGGGLPRVDSGPVPLTSFAGQGAFSGGAGANVGAGAAAATQDVLPVQGPTDAEAGAKDLPDLPAALPGGAIRAALSLGHLAPPKTELARLLAETLMQADTGAESGGSTGTSFARAGSMGGLAAGQAGLAGQVLAALSLTETGSAGEALPQAGAQVAGGAGVDDPAASLRGGSTLGPGGEAATGPGQAEGRSSTAMLARSQAAGVAEAGLARTTADMPLAAADLRSTPPQGPASAIQLAAFAETLTALLAAAEGRGGGSVASGVIFNAAMMPGWPFPSAFAKDGGEAINPRALLHQLAAAVEGMSPEQAAEYMAKIGGGHAFLRGLRKLLKDLDLIEKDEVKGLLFAFLETISTIAGGLQMAFRQMATTASLQAAVVHGEDPDEGGDRPGRRRLRL